jgi:uncharacterized membrane protein (UPF0136 family)
MKLLGLSMVIMVSASVSQATDYSTHTPQSIQQAARNFNIATGTTATVAATAIRFPNTRTILPIIVATTFGSALINHTYSQKNKQTKV